MKYNPEKHHRRSIRLKGYDYTRPGYYFVTICTKDREHFFGEIVDGKMYLSEIGKKVQQCWDEIPQHFPQVRLDEWVIMPDHVHGILVIMDSVEPAGGSKSLGDESGRPRGTSMTIGSIIRGFKSGVTKWARENTDIYVVWHRNYYERIIHGREILQRVRQYIENNPMKDKDSVLFFPDWEPFWHSVVEK